MSAPRKQGKDLPDGEEAHGGEATLDEVSRTHDIAWDAFGEGEAEGDRATLLPGAGGPLPRPPQLPQEAGLTTRKLRAPLPGVGLGETRAEPGSEAPPSLRHPPLIGQGSSTRLDDASLKAGSPLLAASPREADMPPHLSPASLALELSYIPGVHFPGGGPSTIPPPLPSEDDWELNLDAPQTSAMPPEPGEGERGVGPFDAPMPLSAALTPRPGALPHASPAAPLTLPPPTPPLSFAAPTRELGADRRLPPTRSALVASDPPGPYSPRFASDEAGTAPWPPTEPLSAANPVRGPLEAPGSRGDGRRPATSPPPPPPDDEDVSINDRETAPPPLPRAITGSLPLVDAQGPPAAARPAQATAAPIGDAPRPGGDSARSVAARGPVIPPPPPVRPTAATVSDAAPRRRPAPASPVAAAPAAVPTPGRAPRLADPPAPAAVVFAAPAPRAPAAPAAVRPNPVPSGSLPVRQSSRPPPPMTAAPFDLADRVNQMLDHLALGNYRVALGLAESVLVAEAGNGDAIQCAEMCRSELRSRSAATTQRELSVVDSREAGRAEGSEPDRLSQMLDKLSAGNYPAALRLAEAILAEEPGHQDAVQCAEMCRNEMRKMYADRLGSLLSVPRVVMKLGEIRTLSLDPTMGFLLSRIDGLMSLEDIVDSSGIPALDALRSLYQLTLHEVIALDEQR